MNRAIIRYKKRSTLLYRSKVEYAQWCINYVENCAHGCKFPCYAMMMAKRFGKIKGYNDWLKPILIQNSLEILDKEIPKYKNEIDFVHMCFMTDPFMTGYPEVKKMTLRIIEKLNQNGIRVSTLTKGALPAELADKVKYGVKNDYGITLVSLNENFREEFEPNTIKYAKRIDALRKLHNSGLKTWVSMEPFPTPNMDKEQDLNKILDSVRFVDKIVFGKLNYNTKSSQFKDSAPFYEQCAKKIITFCKADNIEYHIKFGTTKNYNKTTETIFNSAEPVKLFV